MYFKIKFAVKHYVEINLKSSICSRCFGELDVFTVFFAFYDFSNKNFSLERKRQRARLFYNSFEIFLTISQSHKKSN